MSERRVVELRSDTFTTPNAEMRKAMADAIVGDDVYKEDPTVNELEKQFATLLGKEAALFVPSGTMGNLIAVMIHCAQRGTEVLVGDSCHIFIYEQGGVAQLGGVHTRTLTTKPDGTFDLDEIRSKIRPDDKHCPVTSLICIENTHLKTGGQPLPLEYLDKLGALKKELGLPLHMDGARLMNAAVYYKVPPAKITEHFDSVCVCLSKGLGAPVGSVLVGTKEFIDKAIRVRKVLGGGMRQAGILAAAGLYSINRMIDRLEEDHQHARQIATAINDLKSEVATVNLEMIKTNIIFVSINPKFISGAEFVLRLEKVTDAEAKDLGKLIVVKTCSLDKTSIRIVTHASVTQEDVTLAIKKLEYVIKEIECNK